MLRWLGEDKPDASSHRPRSSETASDDRKSVAGKSINSSFILRYPSGRRGRTVVERGPQFSKVLEHRRLDHPVF